MRPIYKGKGIAEILLGKGRLNYSNNPTRFFTFYVMPLVLIGLGSFYFFYREHYMIETGSTNGEVLIVSLLTILALTFQLVKTSQGKRAAEKKLTSSRFRFDTIYNSSIIGLLFTRLDGQITQANDHFLEMIGYTKDDLEIGLVNWKTLTPEIHNEVSEIAVCQLKSLGYCEPFEKEYIRKDGSMISVLIASSLLHNSDTADAVTYIIDITHKQQARLKETELNSFISKQKEEFHRLLMNAPAMVSLRRGPELRLEFSNKSYMDYACNNDCLGMSLKESAAKFNLSAGTDILENVYKTGKRFTAKAFNLRFDRMGDGKMEEAWFDIVVEPLLDQKGRVDGVASFGFDVTDLVNANSALKKSEHSFRFLADSLPHKIWTCRPDGKANYYNKGWYDYLDAKTFEELHAAIWRSIHPDDLRTAESVWANAVLTGEDVELEQRFKNTKGEYQWHLTRCCAHKNDTDEIILWVGSCTNIQEQKTVQERADLISRKKDEFLGIASHELKTPITTIKASLQILDSLPENGFDQKKARLFIGTANKQIKKLNSIVDELLDVTRIEAGKMLLNYSKYQLLDSILDCIEEVKPYIKNQRIILQPVDELEIFADRVRVEQVVINLLMNAVKYSQDSGNIIIAVESYGGFVKITVSDNGIGIPSSRLDLVFEKFSRAHDASQKFAGLGLGLYISMQIVKQHGGDMGVNSEAGKGASFWFELPVRAAIVTH